MARKNETVDGDFNGAPALAGVVESEQWEGSDVLDAMQGAGVRREGDEPLPEEMLEDLVADRRALLVERADEARELGLGDLFDEVAEATAPTAGGSPPVADADLLREQAERIDAAIEELERRIEDGD